MGVVRKVRFRSATRAFYLFLVLSIIIAIPLLLKHYGLFSIPETITDFLRVFMLISLTLFVTSIIVRLSVGKVFRALARFGEVEEAIFLSKTYTFVLYAIGLLFIFYELGLSLDNIALVAGLLTTALAFALREIIVSYFIWAIILKKHPFRIGDYIKVGEEAGRVETIGTFFVTLKDKNGNIQKIPNKTFLDKTTINYEKEGVMELIRIPVKKLPNNASERIKKLEENLLTMDVKKPSATFQTDAGSLGLVLNYMVLPKNKMGTRNKVLKYMYEACKGIEKK